jgi:hypothetical protein
MREKKLQKWWLKGEEVDKWGVLLDENSNFMGSR